MLGAGASRSSGKDTLRRRDPGDAALLACPSIYGGSDQVQRNIIGERVLGLPKEPDPDRETPFRDLPANS